MALHPNHLAQGSVKTNLSRICATSKNNAIVYVNHAAVSRAAAVVSNNTHQRTNQASLQKRLHVKPAGSFIKNVFHVYTSSKTPIGILF